MSSGSGSGTTAWFPSTARSCSASSSWFEAYAGAATSGATQSNIASTALRIGFMLVV